MKLEQVVPWGRSLAEYRAMFALSEADLQRRILGCGDGPASFNAEMTAAGRLRILPGGQSNAAGPPAGVEPAHEAGKNRRLRPVSWGVPVRNVKVDETAGWC